MMERRRQRRLLGVHYLIGTLLLLLLLLFSPLVQARRPRPRPAPTTPACRPFFASTFCALAATVTSPAQCAELEEFSQQACPSQTIVCDANFVNLEQYCATTYKNDACTVDCVRYLDACCETTTCCRTSCLEPTVLCQVLSTATCEQARPEICPCSSETRSDEEYCTALVGNNNGDGDETENRDNICVEECLAFLKSCCHLQNGALRLADDTVTNVAAGTIAGHLQVYFAGIWGQVCTNGFDDLDAMVACRELGYHDKGATFTNNNSNHGPLLPFWMTDIACMGDESKMVDCPFPGFGIGYCSTSSVMITCMLEPPSNATQGEVRLLNKIEGDNYVQGVVQVFYNGEWGSVCMDYIDTGIGWNEVTVVCRQLGYSDKGESFCRRLHFYVFGSIVDDTPIFSPFIYLSLLQARGPPFYFPTFPC